jgi:hypothetical protein
MAFFVMVRRARRRETGAGGTAVELSPARRPLG